MSFFILLPFYVSGVYVCVTCAKNWSKRYILKLVLPHSCSLKSITLCIFFLCSPLFVGKSRLLAFHRIWRNRKYQTHTRHTHKWYKMTNELRVFVWFNNKTQKLKMVCDEAKHMKGNIFRRQNKCRMARYRWTTIWSEKKKK